MDFSLKRHGAKHDLFEINGHSLVIPRHKEINEITARNILAAAASFAFAVGEGDSK